MCEQDGCPAPLPAPCGGPFFFLPPIGEAWETPFLPLQCQGNVPAKIRDRSPVQETVREAIQERVVMRTDRVGTAPFIHWNYLVLSSGP